MGPGFDRADSLPIAVRDAARVSAPSRRLRDPLAIAATGVLLLGLVVYPLVTPGALSAHMMLHILLMNVLAPFVALVMPASSRGDPGRLWLATLCQSVALWLAHAPPLHAVVSASPLAPAALQAGLFAVAVWFWRAVRAQPGQGRWHAIAALLVTGKLACLLGALLIFAPRPIYAAIHAHAAGTHEVVLADQQLAGLLMIAACPLSYVLAGILLTANALAELAGARAAAPANAR